MLAVGEIRSSRSGFVFIGEMQHFGAGGRPMHGFEFDGRCRKLRRLGCIVAVLLAGCVSPRAESQKTPILPVSYPSTSNAPTLSPAAAEIVGTPRIEALPPLSDPAETVAPGIPQQLNAGPSEANGTDDLAGRPLTLDEAIALAFEHNRVCGSISKGSSRPTDSPTSPSPLSFPRWPPATAWEPIT